MIECSMTESQNAPDFTTWLMQQATRDDVVGDLAVDVRIDMDMGCMSPHVSSAEQIRDHIMQTHEVDEDVIAFIDFVACEFLFGGDASNYTEVFETEDSAEN